MVCKDSRASQVCPAFSSGERTQFLLVLCPAPHCFSSHCLRVGGRGGTPPPPPPPPPPPVPVPCCRCAFHFEKSNVLVSDRRCPWTRALRSTLEPCWCVRPACPPAAPRCSRGCRSTSCPRTLSGSFPGTGSMAAPLWAGTAPWPRPNGFLLLPLLWAGWSWGSRWAKAASARW